MKLKRAFVCMNCVWMVLLGALVLTPGCSEESGEENGGAGECMAGEARCFDLSSFQLCNSSGAWGPQSLCPTGECCLEGICSPDNPCEERCNTPGVSVCETATSTRLCNENSAWEEEVPCGEGQICTNGECVEDNPNPECDPGETICVGDLIQTCGTDSRWGLALLCAEEGYVCKEATNTCQPGQALECEPNRKRCGAGNDRVIEICNAEGSGWQYFDTCAEGMKCSNGECVPESAIVCDALVETKCDADGKVVTCNEDGTGWASPEPCLAGEHCFDGQCIPEDQIVCVASAETRCTIDGLLEVCNSTGTGFSEPFSCPDGFTCIEGRCIEPACEPGVDFKCTAGGRIRYCNEAGDGYGSPESCEDPLHICVPDVGCTYSTYICQPSSTECVDEHTIRECKDDGSGWEEETIDCPAGNTGSSCLDGICVSLCERHRRTDSYIGCEYWPVALPNPQLDGVFKSGTESEFAVVVSNTNDTYQAEISIEYPTGTVVKSGTVPTGGERTFRLPFNEIEGTFKGMKSFRLESSIPVTVYQFNPITAKVNRQCQGDTSNPCYAHTNDASLLLPTHVLGNTYVAMAYQTMLLTRWVTIFGTMEGPSELGNSAPYLTIVATQENTEVKVTANDYTYAGSGIPALSPGEESPSIILQRGEVLQIRAEQNFSRKVPGSCMFESYEPDAFTKYDFEYCLGSELTGSIVSANKPVAAYSGNECTFVPHYRWACDHLEQQLFPTESWTTTYIAARMHAPLDTHPNIYKVVALEDDTELTTQPNVLTQTSPYSNSPCYDTMNAGDSCLIETSDSFTVISNPGHPIQVAQFLVGQDFNGVGGVSASQGDPAFILIPPVEQFRYDYIFLVPETYATSWITLLTTSSSATVLLDGAPMDLSFSQIGGVNAYHAEHQISPGTYRIESDRRLGVMVYGYDSYVSYAYPAGLDLSFSPY